jgi:NADH:ubiquinone oxidoreductase subunit K
MTSDKVQPKFDDQNMVLILLISIKSKIFNSDNIVSKVFVLKFAVQNIIQSISIFFVTYRKYNTTTKSKSKSKSKYK